MSSGDERQSGVSRFRSGLELCATLSIIAVSITTIWYLLSGPRIPSPQSKPLSPPIPSELLALDSAPVLGDLNASVGIIEFADFQCPYCARFAVDTLPILTRDFVDDGRVLIAFRNMPLPNHPNARAAAQSAVCAHQQGLFWPFQGILYRNSRALDDVSLRKYARGAGLDLSKFELCLQSSTGKSIGQDSSLASSLRVSGTPTFFVGTIHDGQLKTVKVMVGAVSYQDLKSVLDAIIEGRSVSAVSPQ